MNAFSIVASKNSKDKIFHYSNCIYARKIARSNLLIFITKDEARKQGYKQCPYCSRIIKYYKEDKESIDRYLKKHHLQMYMDNDSMYIENIHSAWRITIVPAGVALDLYHANNERYRNLKTKDGHIVHHYHHQKYNGAYDIMHMLKYIVSHDTWRENNLNDYKSMPRRTKKQRNKYNAAKRKSNKKKIANVLNIIERLSIESEYET